MSIRVFWSTSFALKRGYRHVPWIKFWVEGKDYNIRQFKIYLQSIINDNSILQEFIEVILLIIIELFQLFNTYTERAILLSALKRTKTERVERNRNLCVYPFDTTNFFNWIVQCTYRIRVSQPSKLFLYIAIRYHLQNVYIYIQKTHCIRRGLK